MKNYVDKDKLQEFATKLNAKQKTIFATKSEVGSPLVASTVAAMTDTSRVYVYTGSESGYTAGNWYYYDGTAWTSGGVYNSTAFETDTTLAIPGKAADAKAVGDALANVEIEVDATLTQAGMAADAKATGDAIGEVEDEVSDLKTQLNNPYRTLGVDYDIGVGTWENGAFTSWVKRISNKVKIPVKANDTVTAVSPTLDIVTMCMITDESYTEVYSQGPFSPSNNLITYTCPIDGYFIIKFKKTDNSNMMLTDYDATVKIYNTINGKVAKLSETVAENDKSIISLEREKRELMNGVQYYGKIQFAVPHNTAHSAASDILYVDIKSGEKFSVSIDRTNKKENKTATLFFINKSTGEGENQGSVYLDGIQKVFTASFDISGISLYISTLNYDQRYTVVAKPFAYDDTVETEDEEGVLFGNVVKNSAVNLIFFSDVHGLENNVLRIVEYANTAADNVSCIINGGDTVYNSFSDGISWYDDIVDGSVVDVLMAVGNHDVWANNEETKLPATSVYANYIAPIISKVSDIVQPVNAASEGKCYYYKDYGTVRIIILNAMDGVERVQYWNADAASWLESVLSDALANSKHVLCVNHMPFKDSDRIVDRESQWTSWKVPVTSGMYMVPEAASIVQTFIDNGGIFVGWLTGHTHCDGIMHDTNGQFMCTIATAHYPNNQFHEDGFGFTNTEKDAIQYPTFNCFNVIGIDTTNKIFKMTRIGWNMDSALKRRTAYSINYETGTVLTDR